MLCAVLACQELLCALSCFDVHALAERQTCSGLTCLLLPDLPLQMKF